MLTRLCTQTSTTTSTATLNYFATVFSSHTSTETVTTLALQNAWLKSSFHDCFPTLSLTELAQKVRLVLDQGGNSSELRARLQTLLTKKPPVHKFWRFFVAQKQVVDETDSSLAGFPIVEFMQALCRLALRVVGKFGHQSSQVA